MITSKKIEEWIKEVQERPASAPIILNYIADRLRDLTSRNEELLTENIALISGKRIDEYEQRIAHLEYQLELLKRQFGGSILTEATSVLPEESVPKTGLDAIPIIIYGNRGCISLFEVVPQQLENGVVIGRLQREILSEAGTVRILATSAKEEILLVFTSGRVSASPIDHILVAESQTNTTSRELEPGMGLSLDKPRGGEELAYLAPISKLGLAEFFVQVSRKGYVRNIRTSMAQTVLSNHYIGSGVKQPADLTFNISLGSKEDHLVLVSHEGYLLRLELKKILPSVEQVIRLGITDYLVSSFLILSKPSVVVMTQLGKAIHLPLDRLEIAGSLRTKGQEVFSQQRRQKGVRVVGAGAVSEEDWAVALHKDGQICCYSMRSIFGNGTIPAQSELLAFETFSFPTDIA